MPEIITHRDFASWMKKNGIAEHEKVILEVNPVSHYPKKIVKRNLTKKEASEAEKDNKNNNRIWVGYWYQMHPNEGHRDSGNFYTSGG